MSDLPSTTSCAVSTDIIEDEFLLRHVWPWNRHHDVLLSSILRTVEQRDGFVGIGLLVAIEQQLLCPVAWDFAGDEDKVTGVPSVDKVVPSSTGGQGLVHLPTLDPVGLEPDRFLQGP